MQYGWINSINKMSEECLVLGVFCKSHPNQFLDLENKLIKQLIPSLCSRLQEPGDSVWQTEVDGRSLLLIDCGSPESFDEKALKKRMNDICAALIKQRIKSACLYLPRVYQQSANWQLMQMLLQLDAGYYQLNDYKTKHRKDHVLQQVSFYMENDDDQSAEETLATAAAIAAGIKLTRSLADLPPNHCTPSHIAQKAQDLSQAHPSISCNILQENDLRELNMGAFLAVGQGSEQAPCLVELSYQGGGEQAPVVLVGKGITFDSGGLSLKPANAMEEMKYDMSGAASVLGALQACALLKLPINVVGLLACAENMPSGKAIKPGDIVTSMSGQTIEILNTDAEGRLVLADTLTYAERFKPEMVIDIATLTGAMVIALGHITTGFFSNNEGLADEISIAANESGEKCWRLPLDESYQELLDSPIADMTNISSDRTAGSIVAACFLSRFTKAYKWAHLDIAGTAWVSGKKRAATGRPVSLLVQLLRHAASSR